MTTEVRQGLGLVCVAVICALVSLAGTGDVFPRLAYGAAILFGIGGLALVAVGLLRRT